MEIVRDAIPLCDSTKAVPRITVLIPFKDVVVWNEVYDWLMVEARRAVAEDLVTWKEYTVAIFFNSADTFEIVFQAPWEIADE